jgi:hypothetical protein
MLPPHSHDGLTMRELLRSNDPVLMNFAEAVLRQMGIAAVVADQHMSVVEGSIGAFPRRLLVGNEDWAAARRALVEADLGAWLADEEAQEPGGPRAIIQPSGTK